MVEFMILTIFHISLENLANVGRLSSFCIITFNFSRSFKDSKLIEEMICNSWNSLLLKSWKKWQWQRIWISSSRALDSQNLRVLSSLGSFVQAPLRILSPKLHHLSLERECLQDLTLMQSSLSMNLSVLILLKNSRDDICFDRLIWFSLNWSWISVMGIVLSFKV